LFFLSSCSCQAQQDDVTVTSLSFRYRSLFLNLAREMANGAAAQAVSRATDMANPQLVPKKFLNTAPVYPSIADTSNCSRMRIRQRSTGLNALSSTASFSMG